ncbi:MAG: NAD(P)H-hydrate dehydratase [Mariprofundales bacterium]|nr:NAD(P)H-hydrate dehydratase [Mariprofundales bacterium]
MRQTDQQQIDQQQVRSWLPTWAVDAHKQERGHLWLFGGSVGYSGAPRLAAMGAQAMGVGLVSLVVPDEIYPVVASAELESMVHPQSPLVGCPLQADAVVVGPGWGRGQQKMLRSLLASDAPLLIDADALNMVAESEELQGAVRQRRAATLLTPHPGEAGRLLGWESGAKVQRDRVAVWHALVEKYGCVVVLKGWRSLVGSGGTLYVCPFGNNRLAIAGSGDVLAGMIGALLAQRLDAVSAAACGVALHALTVESPGWYRAGQLGDVVAELVASLRRGSDAIC